MPPQNSTTNSKVAKRNAKASSSRAPFPPLNPRGFVVPSYAPPRTRRTLRYTAATALSATTGAIGFVYFRALGLFSPGVAGGHQPMGFDQIMPQYKKFTVLKSKITTQVICQSIPQVVGIQLIKGSLTSSYTNFTGIIESGLAVAKLVPVLQSMPIELSLAQDTHLSMGVSNPLDDDELSGSITADPAEILTFGLFCQDINLSSTGITQFLYTIEYDVVFSEYVQLGQS